jgi:hypothetical protein
VKVGLECQALSYPVDWNRVRAQERNPRFVTFVYPCIEKGVYAFARIAHELGRRRPDIPLLVVESRGTKENLGICGLDLAAAGNLRIMEHDRPAPILGPHQGRAHAFGLVGKPAAGRDRGDDQRH